ncbi:MAG: TonB-dependent receptor [Rubrivivax sp.]|nr:TonB-dependent receptor [Rubrivivax sp.]
MDRCFPATKYEQQAAQFVGYEAKLAWRLPWKTESWLAVFSDQLRGTLEPGGDVPRLAPQRYGLSWQQQHGGFTADARLTRGRAQTLPGANETPTRGWAQLNAGLRYTAVAQDGQELSAFLVGRSLNNAEVRNAASFLRNYAPEPARSVQLGVQWLH